jgi:TrmH family RNA methyltransferase
MRMTRSPDDQMAKFMKRIASRQSRVVGLYRAVARGDDPALLLLDGPHLVREALDSGVAIRHAIVGGEDLSRRPVNTLVRDLEQRGIEIASASAPVMAAVSPVRSPSAIVAVAERPATGAGRMYIGAASLVVVACDVQDPGNIGAMTRVAEAGGASGLVAAGRSADPFGWKALRGSMGSAFRLPIAINREIGGSIAQARAENCRVVATVPRGGRPMVTLDLRGPFAFLVGGEGAGLPESAIAAADERLTIPMRRPVESVNAATAAALVVYEALRQRSAG